MSDRLIEEKRAAAVKAVNLIASGMVVGLGSGSTAAMAIEELGRRMATGELRDICGIPTSNASHRLALEHGIPLVDLESHPVVDLTIDGADEIDPVRRVLKGAGGALLREKIVATRSTRWVIIADSTKVVNLIGSRYPVPVEVVKFGWAGHAEALMAMGADAVRRVEGASAPYITDEGHYIIDARFPRGIEDPERLARELRDRPGVVETGLFLDLNPEVIVGSAALD
ncbi:MAG TPA: ribose 5-phosphate isomerase A [Gemmatimonadaceae bacterium]